VLLYLKKNLFSKVICYFYVLKYFSKLNLERILWLYLKDFNFTSFSSVEGGSGERQVGVSGVLVGNWFKNLDTVSWSSRGGNITIELSVNIIIKLSVPGGSFHVDSINIVRVSRSLISSWHEVLNLLCWTIFIVLSSLSRSLWLTL